MRKTRQEVQELCQKYKTDRLWSWSRFNKYKNSSYEYYLSYVNKTEADNNTSSYGVLGNMVHDTLEKYYNKKIQYEDMPDEFSDAWVTAIDISQLKFDRTDDIKNKNIADKYMYDLQHFFNNHITISYKVTTEQFIIIKVGNYIFQGYIDAVFKDNDGFLNIIDFKTSSIYKGQKAIDEVGQLVLYAEGLRQLGIPLEKIKIGWLFLKYCNVTTQLKNGKSNIRQIERCKIGESLKANVKMWLKTLGYEDKMDNYIEQLLETNSINCLPKDVQDKYVFDDCYVFVDLTQDMIDNLKQDIIETIQEILIKEKEYETIKDDSIFFDSDESVEKQSYYFANLCGWSANLHKPYKKYLEKLENKKNGNDVFSGLGSGLDNGNDDDLAWLNQL